MHVWNGEGSVCFGDSEGVLQNHIRKVVDKNKHFLHSGCRLDRKSFRTGQLAKGCCVTQLLWAQMETIEYEMRARVGWPVVKGCTSCWRWVCTYIELSLGHFSTSSLKNSNSSKKPWNQRLDDATFLFCNQKHRLNTQIKFWEEKMSEQVWGLKEVK